MYTYTVLLTDEGPYQRANSISYMYSISERFLSGKIDCLTLVYMNDLHGELKQGLINFDIVTSSLEVARRV